ncbi:MAG: DNA-binding transcriptional regulator OxyR [Acidobacteria bacterium]|nr:MAG: DNA-binding transcriptional regulator OxyR [Acidobacteriota bacterium]
MMPTVTQLEYLLAVDKERHFSKAAESCCVSQPSLSVQIRNLEDELGVVIFDRSKKPIMTTAIGLDVIEQARKVLKEFKRLQDIADLGSTEVKGEFHLAIIPTLAPYLLPLFIGAFSSAYPRVKLKINEHKTDDIIRLLIDDEIDAGLLVTPLNDDRLIERHLFYEPFHAYASEGHPLLAQAILKENDLDTESLWILEEGHCFREQVLKICSFDKSSTVLPNVEFASGNLETLKTLVKKSRGYTLLPDLAVRDLGEGETEAHVRKFAKPGPTREVSLVHSRDFLKENVIAALEKTIIEKLPPDIKSLKRADIEIIDI